MWHSLFYLSLFIKPVYADYDVNKTKQMLYLAQASYCPKVTPTNWDCKYCENSVILETAVWQYENLHLFLNPLIFGD